MCLNRILRAVQMKADHLADFTGESEQVRFDAPWQARAFALAVRLNESGHLDWSQWARHFSDRIREHERHGSIESSDDYYRLWLDNLEALFGDMDNDQGDAK